MFSVQTPEVIRGQVIKPLKGHFTDHDEIDHLVGEDSSSPGQTGTSTSKIGKQKSIGDHQAAGDRSAAKVLSCLRCGASFESLQD